VLLEDHEVTHGDRVDGLQQGERVQAALAGRVGVDRVGQPSQGLPVVTEIRLELGFGAGQFGHAVGPYDAQPRPLLCVCLDESQAAPISECEPIIDLVSAPHVHVVFVTTYRRGALDAGMLQRCQDTMRKVCADFGAGLRELTGPGPVQLGGTGQPAADVQEHGAAAGVDQLAVERDVRDGPVVVPPMQVVRAVDRLAGHPVAGRERLTTMRTLNVPGELRVLLRPGLHR